MVAVVAVLQVVLVSRVVVGKCEEDGPRTCWLLQGGHGGQGGQEGQGSQMGPLTPDTIALAHL